MDILDIILGKRAATGDAAPLMSRARQAIHDAEVATNNVNSVLETATAANTAAQAASEAANTAVSRANTAANTYDNLLAVADDSMIADFSDTVNSAINAKTAAIDTQLQNAVNAAQSAVSDTTFEDNNNASYKGKRVKVRKNNVDTTYDIEKNYTSTGQNEDGAMTQKAITDALNNQKIFLENKINNIPVGEGGGNVNLNFPNAEKGSLIIVDENGNILPSTITEDDIVQTQMILGTYTPQSALGVEIDYDNRTVLRILEASGLTAGSDFDKYPMYGGRKRCIVKDDGEIVAFYGDSNYIEDGSLGQVMVYQPKFYYLRAPIKVTRSDNRALINKENIYISAVRQSGFSVHPAFLDENNNELDYILLPAYEGSTFDTSINSYNLNDTQSVNFQEDLLCSIANAKPTSGVSQAFNVSNAEQLAQNRGANWHLTDLMSEAINQLLMIIEFGSLNIQNAFNKGITQLTDYNNLNISCFTGATSELGNTSGMASTTTQIYGNTTNTYTVEGTSAISYRGMENFYGNMWNFIGDVKIISNNGVQYLTYKDNKGVTKTFASAIPTTDSWISYFGYDPNALWAFIPSECQGANSAVPVGDYTYVNSQNNNDKCCVIGGKASARDYAGPFYYGMDYAFDTAAQSYNGRIMYKPVYNSDIYLMNIIKWSGGGE